MIGDGVADRPKAQLVAAFALLEQGHDALRALALGLIKINPRQRRHQHPRGPRVDRLTRVQITPKT